MPYVTLNRAPSQEHFEKDTLASEVHTPFPRTAQKLSLAFMPTTHLLSKFPEENEGEKIITVQMNLFAGSISPNVLPRSAVFRVNYANARLAIFYSSFSPRNEK